MRQTVALSLRLLTLGALLCAAAPLQAATDGSGEFVGRRGSSFYVGNKPFRHVGGNFSRILYQPWWQVLRELDYARDSGLKQIRVFLPNNAYANHWDIIARLQNVVNEAYYGGTPRRYLRVTVALTHNYNDSAWVWEGNGGKLLWAGDEQFYTRPSPAGNMLNDSWVDWGYQINYWPRMRDTVWALRNNPGIFAWDIANEVNVSNANDRWLVGRLVDFYTRVAGEIRALDPNHLITTGLITSSWGGMQDPERDRLYNNANIDYLTVHMYECNCTTPGEPHENTDAQRDELWRANKRYLKPVVLEEFGTLSYDWAKAKYAEYFTGNADFQADAILYWHVTAWTPAEPSPWQTANPSQVEWSPITQPVLNGSGQAIPQNDLPYTKRWDRQYRALWARWAGQLDTRVPLVIDNNSANNDTARTSLSFTGAWSASTWSGRIWGNDYRTATANGGATGEDGAAFWFYLDAAATRGVWTWFNGGSSRASAVPYVVYNAAGTHVGTAYVNQQQAGDQWVKVGDFAFTAGWNRVVISRWTGASGAIIADAVRIW